jgi:flagellar hook protein FlgE
MSIMSALYTGASGLNSFGQDLSVIGNNISNSSTIGYKSSQAVFADLVADKLGSGVYVSAVQGNFNQGTVSTTGNTLDLGIEGNGFFQVTSASGGTFFTRDGQFHKDENGNVVDANGYQLQGYQASAAGVIGGTLGNINLGTATVPAKITSSASYQANLDAGSTVPTGAFSVTDPSTYNFSTSQTIYDSLGGTHSLNLYFTKTSTANTWSLQTQLDGGAATAGTNLVFNSSGTLTSGGTQTLSLTIGNGATTPQSVTLDLSKTTQFGAPSSTISLSQDGYGAGSLEQFAIQSDGTIIGSFSNNQSRKLAQVALTQFASEVGLNRVGQNLFTETPDSGPPATGTPNSGGLGTIRSGSLELSNVDLGSEFVNMISAQRGFQANSRVITTSDQLLNELVNLIR